MASVRKQRIKDRAGTGPEDVMPTSPSVPRGQTVLHVVLVVAALIIGVLTIGLIGHQDAQTQLQLKMSDTCSHSYQVNDGFLEDECGKLIGAVQSDGKHEVISNNGQFWTEIK